MKKIALIGLGLFSVFVIYLAIKGNEMKEIRTEIEIAASPAKVWSILVDINKWQEWSPVINKSSGTAAVGAELKITMSGKDKGKDGPSYSPIITQLEEEKYFSWSATMMAGFIFTNGKHIELEETATGTRLIHRETFKGMMAAMMWGQMEKGVPPILNSMNKALKKIAEEQ